MSSGEEFFTRRGTDILHVGYHYLFVARITSKAWANIKIYPERCLKKLIQFVTEESTIPTIQRDCLVNLKLISSP